MASISLYKRTGVIPPCVSLMSYHINDHVLLRSQCGIVIRIPSFRLSLALWPFLLLVCPVRICRTSQCCVPDLKTGGTKSNRDCKWPEMVTLRTHTRTHTHTCTHMHTHAHLGRECKSFFVVIWKVMISSYCYDCCPAVHRLLWLCARESKAHRFQ